MRLSRSVCFTFFFIVLGIGLAQGAKEVVKEQTAAPVIVVEEPTYNFGQVAQGESVTHDFRVLNQGTVPLEIKKVKPG